MKLCDIFTLILTLTLILSLTFTV